MTITVAEVAELTDRVATAADLFMRGDMRGYLELIEHAEDYTLLPPFGGPVRFGFHASDSDLDEMSRYRHADPLTR